MSMNLTRFGRRPSADGQPTLEPLELPQTEPTPT